MIEVLRLPVWASAPLVASAAILEMATLYFWCGSAWRGAGLLTHLFATFLAAAGLALVKRRPGGLSEASQAWFILCLALAFTLPGLGLVGLVLVRRTPFTGGGALEGLKEHTLAPPSPDEGDYRNQAERMRDCMETVNVLRTDDSVDVASVRALVDSVPEFGDREKLHQLQRLMDNPRSDAYHLAAAKISRLHAHFNLNIVALQDKIRRQPQLIDHQLTLVDLYSEYVKSGLLDPSLESYYVGLWLKKLDELSQLDSDNPSWRIDKTRLLIQRKQYQRALEEADRLLTGWPGNEEALLLILEVHYEGARSGSLEGVRRFQEAIEVIRAVLDPAKIPESYRRELASWWCGEGVGG